MDESRPSRTAPASPTISLAGTCDWSELLAGAPRAALEATLAERIARRRWFGSKARRISSAKILDAFRLTAAARLLLVEIRFAAGPAEVYQLPVALAGGPQAARLLAEEVPATWARLQTSDPNEPAVLYDALYDDAFCGDLLRTIEGNARFDGETGELVAWRSEAFAEARGGATEKLAPRLSQAEQSNSSVIFGDHLILKLYRRLETGMNPDLELNTHLTKQGFTHVPPLAGAIEYRRTGEEPWGLALLQKFVPNQGDAWQYFLSRLEVFLRDTAGGTPLADELAGDRKGGLTASANEPVPAAATAAMGGFLADAGRLGRRTAEMHLALAASADDASFAPQPLSPDEQRAFAERTCTLVDETFALLQQTAPTMPGNVGRRAADVLARRQVALDRAGAFADAPLDVRQIRCHGDYHLGQVLVSGDDFVIIDFEGEPARSLAERRKKQLALRDVAGMIRSFHYASCSAATTVNSAPAEENRARFNAWAEAWYYWTSVAFLAAYRNTAGSAVFVPASEESFRQVLDACLLEKAVYELRYELNNRPDWVYLPLAALAELLA